MKNQKGEIEEQGKLIDSRISSVYRRNKAGSGQYWSSIYWILGSVSLLPGDLLENYGLSLSSFNGFFSIR
jgi:hypothetical protein